MSSSDAKWDKVLPFVFNCFNSMPRAEDLESPFFLIHGRDPIEGHTALLSSGNVRYMGGNTGLILFAKLRKFWLMHAKNLQESRLSKKSIRKKQTF